MNNEQELLERISKQTPIFTVRDRKLDGLKPVVPQFVADWYEEHKDNFEFSVQRLCVHGCEPVRKIDAWFDSDNTRPIETLVMMHKFGYEIEREKLYTVEIPNPNGDGYRRVYLGKKLGKNEDNKIKLHVWDCFPSIEFSNDWKQLDIAQLTEAEIKEDFAWAWKYAKEVEE